MASTNELQTNMISAVDIVKLYKITYQTVNHYTDFGLLPVVFKKGNVRYYDRGLVQVRLRKITTRFRKVALLHKSSRQ